MILADKIIDLRKKNGWSQEELAEKLNVSRQSVSKWEGAQSIPDMNKLLAMSHLFGVSTDYLLKDELGPEHRSVEGEISVYQEEKDFQVHSVSMEEANLFLQVKEVAAHRIALGVMLCILAAAPMMLLIGLTEAGKLPLSEDAAVGFGAILLLFSVGFAVAIFIINSMRMQKYEYLEEETIETAYGVDGMVRERREQFRGTYTVNLTVGIVLCILAAIPIFATMLMDSHELLTMIAISATLFLVALGVFMIVKVQILWSAFSALLEEGEYSRRRKEENKRNTNISTLFWTITTAVYLAWSLYTFQWRMTWIIWPVAGVLHEAIKAFLRIQRRENG